MGSEVPHGPGASDSPLALMMTRWCLFLAECPIVSNETPLLVRTVQTQSKRMRWVGNRTGAAQVQSGPRAIRVDIFARR
jgi:hypothetical protein